MPIRNKLLYFIYVFIKSGDFSFYDKLRTWIIKKITNSNVKNLVIRSNVIIQEYKKLKLGNDISINHGCFLSCYGGLSIGDYVSIGHNTSIITTEHSFTDVNKPIKYQPIIEKSVIIGNNVWIGANVTLLAGVSIADGTIIAAGAVVNKSIERENTIVAGVPARHIKIHSYV